MNVLMEFCVLRLEKIIDFVGANTPGRWPGGRRQYHAVTLRREAAF
jgi:hypothetical protein